MKKIDLHIHTVPTELDANFAFDGAVLERYVKEQSIDCIAITNHNLFNLEQFLDLDNALDCVVLPGIEINFEKGHLLLISDASDLGDFSNKCDLVASEISDPKADYLKAEQLKKIFLSLNKYLLIPHYDKDASIEQDTIEKMREFVSAGEVGSHKKFKYHIKQSTSLVPVLFSDLRPCDQIAEFPARQTFIDTNDVTLSSIKGCLLDKNKVHLSNKGGCDFLQIFENGQVVSTGLNVVLGERSSGKTYSLNRISQKLGNVKYIKQFELLEKDEEKDTERFNKLLSARQSSISDQYLKEFKDVVEDVAKIDQKANEEELANYINSLKEVSAEQEKKDSFSQATLFNENVFNVSDNKALKDLIRSVEVLIENNEYKNLIEKYITDISLKRLIVDLIGRFRETYESNLKKTFINSVVSNIKRELESFTASSSIKEVNFYKIMQDKEKLLKFEYIANHIKNEGVIKKEDVRRFQVVASKKQYSCAQELIDRLGKRVKFSDAYSKYGNPLDFLSELKKIDMLPRTEYYKYFVNIQYRILNEDGIEVSGGERSEFNLLEKIQNAHQYDLLLIDEPESSFDNLFLKSEVNTQIKEISKSLPVIIVTHNSTVGASIKPDYVLYTRKEIINRRPVFKVYSGYPSDKTLKTPDGEEISNYEIMLNCLEAGDLAYKERGRSYEVLQN